jgi:hypothetical protein
MMLLGTASGAIIESAFAHGHNQAIGPDGILFILNLFTVTGYLLGLAIESEVADHRPSRPVPATALVAPDEQLEDRVSARLARARPTYTQQE